MNHGHDHADHQHHHHQEMITKARMVMNQPAVATTIAAANHGGHSSHLHDMMMSMTFHGGYKEVILFNQWKTESVGAFIGSWFLIFFAAILYEGLKTIRDQLAKREARRQYAEKRDPQSALIAHADEPVHTTEVLPRSENARPKLARLLNIQHILQTFLHILQMGISYLLMLIAMTFNTYLFLAIILGAGVGHFLFGWRRSSVIDYNEHCH